MTDPPAGATPRGSPPNPDALKSETEEALQTALRHLNSFSVQNALQHATAEQQTIAAQQRLALQTALLQVQNASLAQLATAMRGNEAELQSAADDVKAIADRIDEIAPWLNRISGLLSAVSRIL